MYKSYGEIPVGTVEYLLSVADVKDITDIPLTDINSFLEMLDQTANEMEIHNG